jgi:TetR/AcrR family transcriptional regulator, regulator of cefoperazone and chloramphenicol sensitivity
MPAMPRSSPNGQTRSDATRAALIAAATEVFARSGFEAVGTREIASAAGVHPALIGYHFGGKEGLYLAVFEHIASTMEQRVGPALAGIEAALAEPAEPAAASARGLAMLCQLCDAMMATLADEASGPWGPLMMREQQSPTPAFDLIYERFMQRMLGAMTKLVRVVDASRSEPAARLTVVSIMGQIMVFRVARAGVMRHLGWRQLGPAELALAQDAVRDNVRRMCTAAVREASAERRGQRRSSA